jgi:hypothetical protein
MEGCRLMRVPEGQAAARRLVVYALTSAMFATTHPRAVL